jgi:hypothetical protein
MTGVAGTADFRERCKIGAQVWRSIMRQTLHLSALVALSLSGAFAQGNGTVAPAVPQNTGSAGISSAPGDSSTTATGMGARTNPNAGNRTTGRSAGRSAAASPRLPSDDPANPGLSAIGGH